MAGCTLFRLAISNTRCSCILDSACLCGWVPRYTSASRHYCSAIRRKPGRADGQIRLRRFNPSSGQGSAVTQPEMPPETLHQFPALTSLSWHRAVKPDPSHLAGGWTRVGDE